MEQNLNNTERLFLEEVTLSGYKSIHNTNITFNKGINVIIGKNAVGKTNFFTFLFKMLNFSYDNLYKFKSTLLFESGKLISIEAQNNLSGPNLLNSIIIATPIIKTKVYIDDSLFKEYNGTVTNIKTDLPYINIHISPVLVRHGVPRNFYFIDQSFYFEISDDGFSSELFALLENDDLPYFVKSLATSLYVTNFQLKEDKNLLNIDDIKRIINKSFERIVDIKVYLKKITPIEDIRINENFNIFPDGKQKYTVNNLFVEFLIAGAWHPFSNLSDGTQRLFYLISEVAFESIFFHANSEILIPLPNNINRIILIEEPELGIHPHQLHELMLFLKEQSRHKQIIITTHSPEVLDILGKDELDNIIIASYEKGEGTKLRHLDDAEIAKAQQYMEEDYLSDYWRFSDLEKEKI